MSASEAFVETLAAHGVTHVFGIVGSAYMDALDLFEAAGIRFISVAHEQGGGHMADGFSRASGRHGVCIAQNGPGITNFVTAIAAAYWAHSPVVMITPETGSNTQGLGGFQETEQLPFFEKITKYQIHCANQARIPELLSRCFDYASLERGPTQFNIPRDLFYGEFDATIPKPIRVERGAGGPESLEAAVKLLAGAKFPVILSGGGVVMADGVGEVVKLAEYLTAPVINTYLHNDSFPKSHQLWCGPIGYQGSKAAMKLLAKADVVLAIGTRLGPFGTLPQHGLDYWPKDAKLIQIEANPRRRPPSASAAMRPPRRRKSCTACRPAMSRSRRARIAPSASARSRSRRRSGRPSSTNGARAAARRSARVAPCASSRGRCRKTPW
jgi:sulfoacetaldehyde acetyltransferase